MLNISNDDDSSDDEGDNDGSGLARAFWNPVKGNISMMTTDLVKLVAQMTDCSFFPNGANQVGITGNNYNRALRKLQNLEKLQVCRLSLEA